MAPARFIVSIGILAGGAAAAFHYPDSRTSALEHLLVDTDGNWRSGFKDAISPCANYVSGPQTLGRTTAAQWMRVAFHDVRPIRTVNNGKDCANSRSLRQLTSLKVPVA